MNTSTERQKKHFLRKKATAIRTAYSEHHVMRKAQDPFDDFPSPIKLGDSRSSAVVFVEDEIDAWLESQILKRDEELASRKEAPNTEHGTAAKRS
jgi:predicted DNA-binding transcriptional regulator AlpA